MQKTTTILTTLAALAALAGSALAQTPPPPPPVHHGLFSKLFHPKPKPRQPVNGNFGRPGTYPSHHGIAPIGGGVVGNKKSHVYHLPGDKGALPAPQNRVYFRSAAAAEAAGFHRAGGMHTMGGHRPIMHGSPMNGMHGAAH